MATEVKVPTLGESVTEATVGELLKNVGDAVAVDEPIVSLETDKVAVERSEEHTSEGRGRGPLARRRGDQGIQGRGR